MFRFSNIKIIKMPPKHKRRTSKCLLGLLLQSNLRKKLHGKLLAGTTAYDHIPVPYNEHF